jgi:hypothetical protein
MILVAVIILTEIFTVQVNCNPLRKLSHHNIYVVQHPSVGLGNFVPNVTIYGAIITAGGPSTPLQSITDQTNQLKSNSSIAPVMDVMTARMNNVKQLQQLLPFALVEWPPIFTKPCPQFSHGHKTERGVALAHYQIWLDFVFFDNDVLDAMKRPKPEYLSSTPYSSISGKFTAYENGSLYKDGVPFRDDGIVFYNLYLYYLSILLY